MTEKQAARILELERDIKMRAWDKEHPAPKPLTLEQKVRTCVNDPKWRAAAIAEAKRGNNYDWSHIKNSPRLRAAELPAVKHRERRQQYETTLIERDRVTIIKMLRGQ